MKIALAQINPTVGELHGNAGRIKDYIEKARAAGAAAVAFPELALTGYPPEDLLLKKGFVNANVEELQKLASSVSGITALVGFADPRGNALYNAAAVIKDGAVKQVYHKNLLPNYGVFDEKRYFKPGTKPLVVTIAGVKTGISVCEDIWFEEGPVKCASAEGAELIIVLNASPYDQGKLKAREKVIQKQAKANRVHIAYVNLVGGQDELVFDGCSIVVDPQGKVIARADEFKEELMVVDLPLGEDKGKSFENRVAPVLGADEEVYEALVTGLRDYVRKNGFSHVVLGLSGGIDSSIVAALAVDALGSDKVHGVFMPTRYSSRESLEDAEGLAKNLNIDFRTIAIDELFGTYLSVMEPHFRGLKQDLTEENLQARIRGTIVMALSNKFGWLVLTTGNKSEMSTGYATLYGDMAGGLAVIKDVPKVLVYRISNFRNTRGPAIPQRVITKEPTAELRPNQKDSDSLPVYERLDPLLREYVEEDKGMREMIAEGHDPAMVKRVVGLVDKSEYKRRQAPPGIKITPKAFGRDRRMPITNRYREDA